MWRYLFDCARLRKRQRCQEKAKQSRWSIAFFRPRLELLEDRLNPSGPPTSLSILGPTGASVGTAIHLTVIAEDAAGKVVTDYAGTVHLSSSDLKAGLPSDYPFQANDAGSHTFNVTMETPGPQTVVVTDTSDGQLTQSTLAFTATAGPAPPQTASVAYDLTHSYSTSSCSPLISSISTASRAWPR
jgi:hypothetical protein